MPNVRASDSESTVSSLKTSSVPSAVESEGPAIQERWAPPNYPKSFFKNLDQGIKLDSKSKFSPVLPVSRSVNDSLLLNSPVWDEGSLPSPILRRGVVLLPRACQEFQFFRIVTLCESSNCDNKSRNGRLSLQSVHITLFGPVLISRGIAPSVARCDQLKMAN